MKHAVRDELQHLAVERHAARLRLRRRAVGRDDDVAEDGLGAVSVAPPSRRLPGRPEGQDVGGRIEAAVRVVQLAQEP
jgi:hypothetical protein